MFIPDIFPSQIPNNSNRKGGGRRGICRLTVPFSRHKFQIKFLPIFLNSYTKYLSQRTRNCSSFNHKETKLLPGSEKYGFGFWEWDLGPEIRIVKKTFPRSRSRVQKHLIRDVYP
jgi:hypothetical protein